MSRGGVTRSKKDVLLELVSRDIKEVEFIERLVNSGFR